MAVITRFIVVRNGKELDKVFDEKKLAEAYDKMLDAAENLAALIKQGDLQIDLDAETIDEISIYLAKNGPEVTRILKGIKPMAAAPATAKPQKPADPTAAPAHTTDTPPTDKQKAGGKKAGSRKKEK